MKTLYVEVTGNIADGHQFKIIDHEPSEPMKKHAAYGVLEEPEEDKPVDGTDFVSEFGTNRATGTVIVIEGNFVDGVTFYGPFEDNEGAISYAEDTCHQDWSVVGECR